MRPARVAAVQRFGLPTTLLATELAEVGERAPQDMTFVSGGQEDAVSGGQSGSGLVDIELKDPGVVAGPGGHVRSQPVELAPPLRIVYVDAVGSQDEEIDVAVGPHGAPGRRSEQHGGRRRQ